MSLLLNALKQAEKNKSEAVFPVKDAPENTADFSAPLDEGLVELEMLPDFDLSDTSEKPVPETPTLDTRIIHVETALTFSDTDTTVEPALSLVEGNNADAERLEPAPGPIATTPNQTETTVGAASLPTATPYETPEPLEPEPAQTLAAKPEMSDSAALKSSAERKLAETLISLNKREATDRRNGFRWMLAILLFGLISVVSYLYWLTLPPVSNPYSIAAAIETEAAQEGSKTVSYDDEAAVNAELPSAQNAVAIPADITAEDFPATTSDRETPALEENRFKSEPQPSFRPTESDRSYSIEPAAGYADSTNAISVKRRQRIPETAVLLKEAYQTYQNRDDITATRLYREVLSLKPHNIDALLGLGAIAERQGNAPQARYWFEQALASDGNNAFAQNALARLADNANPADRESRLKSLIDRGLADGGTYAELGNLFASDRRWRDAQAAYFQAVEKQPEHALYHYNLAVALDRLNKADIALRYYRQAYHLSKRQTVPFDRGRILQRIQQLEQR